MIGNTEGLLGAGSELFEMADKKQKIDRKKLVPTPITFGFSVTPRDYHVEESERSVSNRYAPPSVIVSDQIEIVQIKGHTGKYLEVPSGRASLNLLKMARPGLLFELRASRCAAQAVQTEGQRRQLVQLPTRSLPHAR
jgi:two-component system CheB/CheR fusion protein